MGKLCSQAIHYAGVCSKFMHLDYQSIEKIQSASANDSKCNYCTLEEMALLRIIKDEHRITQKELAFRTGKSERTIKTNTVRLQEKGFLERKSGRSNGYWVLLQEI